MKRHPMRTNPQVCFEVERVDDLTTWRSVIAWGSYEELTGDDAAQGMRMLADPLMPILRHAEHIRTHQRATRDGVPHPAR